MGPTVIGYNHLGSIFKHKAPPLGQKCKIFEPKVMGPNHGGEPLGSILGPIGAKKWGPTAIGHNHPGSIFYLKGSPFGPKMQNFRP